MPPMAASEEEEIFVVPGSLGNFQGAQSGGGDQHPLLRSYPALLGRAIISDAPERGETKVRARMV